MQEVARQLEEKMAAINESEKQLSKEYELNKLKGMAEQFEKNNGNIKNKFRIGADGKKYYTSDELLQHRIHAASTPVSPNERFSKLAEESRKIAKSTPRYGNEGQKEEEFAEEMGWNR